MYELFNQIQNAVKKKLYFIAFFTSLSIPDICSALESKDNRTDSTKYKAWFNKYMSKLNPNKYGENGQLKAEHLWKVRCSLFHQGLTTVQNEYKRVLFIEPGNPTYKIHCCIVGAKTKNKSLLIDVVKFCNDMIKCVKEWEKDIKNNEYYAENYNRLIKRYPLGVAPVFGTPVIG